MIVVNEHGFLFQEFYTESGHLIGICEVIGLIIEGRENLSDEDWALVLYWSEPTEKDLTSIKFYP